jgi:phenylacetate-CoA ligase
MYGWKVQRIQSDRKVASNTDPFYYFNSNRFDNDLKVFQENQIKKLVTFSYYYIPGYSELYRSHGFHPNDFRSLDDLQKIPILNKDIIRKNPGFFVDRRRNSNRLLKINTSGTTGSPLTVYFDRHVRKLNYAFYHRFLRSVGINPSARKAIFGGRVIASPKQIDPPFWRYSLFQNSLLFSSYHLNSKNCKYYVNKLIQYRPEFIDSYPSAIAVLSRYINNNNINCKSITKAIITSAECLYPWQRKEIETAFAAPVYDHYGCAEMCVMIYQCQKFNYHAISDYGYVEFLGPDDKAAKPGEEGDIVCTGFINPVMPFIRYRIGDRGILSKESCPCGSRFPIVQKIVGRSDDVITTPGGCEISRFGAVLYKFPVAEVQFVQNSINEIDIFIVKDKGYSNDSEIGIREELRLRLGDRINFQFIYVNSINRGPGAKLKTIISEIK